MNTGSDRYGPVHRHFSQTGHISLPYILHQIPSNSAQPDFTTAYRQRTHIPPEPQPRIPGQPVQNRESTMHTSTWLNPSGVEMLSDNSTHFIRFVPDYRLKRRNAVHPPKPYGPISSGAFTVLPASWHKAQRQNNRAEPAQMICRPSASTGIRRHLRPMPTPIRLFQKILYYSQVCGGNPAVPGLSSDRATEAAPYSFSFTWMPTWLNILFTPAHSHQPETLPDKSFPEPLGMKEKVP